MPGKPAPPLLRSTRFSYSRVHQPNSGINHSFFTIPPVHSIILSAWSTIGQHDERIVSAPRNFRPNPMRFRPYHGDILPRSPDRCDTPDCCPHTIAGLGLCWGLGLGFGLGLVWGSRATPTPTPTPTRARARSRSRREPNRIERGEMWCLPVDETVLLLRGREPGLLRGTHFTLLSS